MTHLEKNIKTAVLVENHSTISTLNKEIIANNNTYSFDNVFYGGTPFEEIYNVTFKPLTTEFLNGENTTFFLYGNYKQEELFYKGLEETLKEIINHHNKINISVLAIDETGIFDLLSDEMKIHTITDVMGIIKPFEFNYFQSEYFITNKNILSSIKSNKTTKHIIYEFIDSIKKNTYRLVLMTSKKKNQFDYLAFQSIFTKLIEKTKNIGFYLTIDYRLSNITHYLKDSFGGNTSTLVFANIDFASENSQRFIQLTNLAKNIKNVINVSKTTFDNSMFEVIKQNFNNIFFSFTS